ncbi:MAG: PhnA domain-containing protein [Kangiellaceae bacterium]|nr:PhnA domain-containing protein [Kangiellaceae bacterium]
MSVEQTLQGRSNNKCELCASDQSLSIYEIPPTDGANSDKSIYICEICKSQIEGTGVLDTAHHWRCLSDSMWSAVPAVQVMAWRMLTRLKDEGWPQDLLEMFYLDDETLSWAQASGEGRIEEEVKHFDNNGAVLEAGDTVTLIKDLNVKGANFTAKRGTAVRGISLVDDNPEHIEGKIEGQRIVILTKFVKKTN